MIQASDLFTIALLIALEGLLSADNALVIAVMVLGLPKRDHKGALHYGLVGAFAFRIAATLLAVYLIALGWVKLLGGLYLLYLAYRIFPIGDPVRNGARARPGSG
jgi:predicted tellurium resistance membrane protein TerC